MSLVLAVQVDNAVSVVTGLRADMRRQGVPDDSMAGAYIETAVRCLTALQKELGARLTDAERQQAEDSRA